MIVTIYGIYICYKKKIYLFRNRRLIEPNQENFTDIVLGSTSTSTSSDLPPNYNNLYYGDSKEKSNEDKYDQPEEESLPKYNE